MAEESPTESIPSPSPSPEEIQEATPQVEEQPQETETETPKEPTSPSPPNPPNPPNPTPPPPAQQQPSASQSVPEGPQEKKARDLCEQAEKKVRSSQGFFGGLFGKSVKLEEAADLYVRAANAYKVAKRNKAAGHSFKKAAEIHLSLDTKHEAASNYSEAAQVMKRDDPKEAVECYLHAVEIYTDMGRFSLAARYHSNVAEIYENELQDYESAISNYEQAADFHRGEDSISAGNKCLVKVALLCSGMQQFEKAAGIFEDIGRSSLENTLLKYGAKDYFFKAALCRFCITPDEAREAIGNYRNIHPGFEGTRELKLILDLLLACDDEDPDKFAEIVKDYDSISRIDGWLTGLLLHIKKAINAAPDIN